MSGTQTFEVRNLVFASGERFPVLIDGDTGVPDFEVTLYVLTQLRTRNLSTSTLTAATRSVMFGCQVLDYMGVDLQNRINQGKLLEPVEFDRLMDSFFWTQEKLREALSQSTDKPAPNRVLSLESVRKSVPALDNSQTINADTAATRLIYFRDFLKWKVDRSLFALATTHENYQGLTSAKEFMVGAINARMPKGSAKNDLDARQGLSSEETVLLLESVKLDSDRNPWKSEFIRVRNRLIVHLLLNLGLRKGELLGIKVGDMNLEKNELTIHRRADDFEDPRSIQPNAKTNSRILYVDQELASALHAYVVKYRQAVGGARRHPFLFVANGSGAPMSISALDVVFSDIRNKFPSKFERLSAHILRHTWNDKFSEVMDKHGVGEAKEEEARSYAMGWKSGSGTARVYTRRQRSKNLDDQLIRGIVEILDGWSEDLTWDGLVEAVDRRLGQRYTRQALHKHERIKQAFTARKTALAGGQAGVRKTADPVLQLTLDRLARVEAENERLKRENAALLEQFVRWTYNAGLKGLTLDVLNLPLPAVNRGQSDRGVKRVK